MLMLTINPSSLSGLTAEQLTWMKADQEQAYDDGNGQTHTFIFTHAPSVPDCKWDQREKHLGFHWDTSHYSDINWDFAGPYDNDVAFVDWLNGEDGDNLEGIHVEAVFAGHTHQDFVFTGIIVTHLSFRTFKPPSRISGSTI